MACGGRLEREATARRKTTLIKQEMIGNRDFLAQGEISLRAIATFRKKRFELFLLTLWVTLNTSIWFAPDIVLAYQRYQLSVEVKPLVEPYDLRFQSLCFDKPCSCWPERAVKYGLPYLQYSPKNADDTPLPLLVVLHGAGDRMDIVKGRGRAIADYFTTSEFQARFPCYLLGPVCPKELSWSYEGCPMIPATVIQMIDAFCESRPIDKSRIYLAGHSMGAFGCFSIVAENPTKFAAVMPVAGGGDETQGVSLAKTPFWIVHGDSDATIEPKFSEVMVKAIRDAGGTAHHTVYPEVGHDSWKYLMTTLGSEWEWLFSQRNPHVGEFGYDAATLHSVQFVRKDIIR